VLQKIKWQAHAACHFHFAYVWLLMPSS